MHSRITLILRHHHEHRPILPTITLFHNGDREAQICFHEADDESSELVGCPECLIHLLRGTADQIEQQLAAGEWLETPPEDAPPRLGGP